MKMFYLVVEQGMVVQIAPAGHVRTLQTGPQGLGRPAAGLRTLPLLGVEGGVVLAQPQAAHVLAAVHCGRRNTMWGCFTQSGVGLRPPRPGGGTSCRRRQREGDRT